VVHCSDDADSDDNPWRVHDSGAIARWFGASKVQFFACWADVDITLGIIDELLRPKERHAMIVIRKGNVGTEVLAL